MHEMEYSFTLPWPSSAIAVDVSIVPVGNQIDYALEDFQVQALRTAPISAIAA